MSAGHEESFRTPDPVPDGAVLVGGVEVVSYLAEGDGRQMYRVRLGGDMPLSQVLGLLEMAKMDAVARYDWQPG